MSRSEVSVDATQTDAVAQPDQLAPRQVSPDCIPVVTALDPPRSVVLQDFTIIGQRFQPTAATCGPLNVPPVVTFLDSHPGGPLLAAVKSFNDTQIVVRVPNGAKTSQVAVTNTKGFSSPVLLTFTVLPTITSFSPQSGGVGTAVTIRGTGLYNTPQFFFAGLNGQEIPASFSNPTLDSIVVAVPAGAITGPIKVRTKGGGETMTATPFTVTAATPQVGNISPTTGEAGTKVTIFAKPGTKFEAIQSVSFLTDPNAVGQARRIRLNKGEFAVSGNRERIECLVPFGAVSGKIRVTNDQNQSGSSPRFSVRLNAPGSLAARPLAGQKIELTWRDATSTETGFRLERTIGENDAGYATIATLPPNSNTFVDGNVAAGTTYRYRLFAFNGKEGDSAPSNAAIATANGSLQVTPRRLSFTATRKGSNPGPQPITIERTITTVGEQSWMVDDDSPWLSVRPASGTTPAMATVAVDIFGLEAGRHTGVIKLRATGPQPTVLALPVELVLQAPPGAVTIEIVTEPEAANA